MSLAVVHEKSLVRIAAQSSPAAGIAVPRAQLARFAEMVRACPSRSGDHHEMGDAAGGASVERTGMGEVTVWPSGAWQFGGATAVRASAQEWERALSLAAYALTEPDSARTLAEQLEARR